MHKILKTFGQYLRQIPDMLYISHIPKLSSVVPLHPQPFKKMAGESGSTYDNPLYKVKDSPQKPPDPVTSL